MKNNIFDIYNRIMMNESIEDSLHEGELPAYEEVLNEEDNKTIDEIESDFVNEDDFFESEQLISWDEFISQDSQEIIDNADPDNKNDDEEKEDD